MFKKKKHSPKRLQTQDVSPINKSKIYALADIYNQLPSNSFSKLTVTLCFIGIFGIIIASFVFLFLGFDPTGIAQCGLLAFTAELFILGARTLFSKEQTENDIIFDQIKRDINDGKYYGENGEIVYEDKNIDKEIEEKEEVEEKKYNNENINDNINNKENNISSTFQSIPSVIISTSTPKKRGRPKKQTKVEVEDTFAQQKDIEFGSADDDGRG